jgi:hypothetical protein
MKKKYLALAMCLLMLCAVLISSTPVQAEEVEPNAAPPITETEQTTLPEDSLPPTTDDDEASVEVPTTDSIKAYVEENLEEISVIVTLICTIIYQVRKNIALNASIKTLNNNAITIADSSSTSINNASATVGGFVEQMNTLLAEVRNTAEEKKKLEVKLDEVTRYINTAKLANVELANEMAELLVLANIPNSKKEELYSRHRAAVDAINTAERTEVTRHDGAEA